MLQVLSKLDLRISDTMIEKIASATEGTILHLLTQFRLKSLKSLKSLKNVKTVKTAEAEGGSLNSIACNGSTDSGKVFQSTN
jgi:transcription elongation factor